MANNGTFLRYELKFLLSKQDANELKLIISSCMKQDSHGKSTIRNVYFDTDTYRLIRNSIEKPMYKEKLRMRSYKQSTSDTPVFIELKKKYNSLVYKRRIELPEGEAMRSFNEKTCLPANSQICNEIEYFRQYYQTLHPAVFLSYDREAFFSTDGNDLRITFDENILYRQYDLSLCSKIYGTSLLKDGLVLMEIKTSRAIPLWLAHILSERKIYKTSFSKYGAAYIDMVYNKNERGIIYA